MELKPGCAATAIGSMPYSEASRPMDVVFGAIPNAPIWAQLSKRGLHEQMEIQYSEGLPRIVIDEEKGRMYFDTSGDYSEELAEFYEGYLAAEEEGDCSPVAISPEYSAGIPALEERLKGLGKTLPIVKCQTTGPISFALTVVDENKKAIYYNEEFLDPVVKGLAMKCRWQIQKFKPYAEHVICFVDEPILSAFGSSTYVSVQRDDVVARLNEVVEAIHTEGGIAGIHCCGNTEWSILVDAGAGIVNFDAFDYGESVALYPEHMQTHLVERSNALAWGVVPTNAAIRDESVESLVERFEKVTDHLADKAGIDKQVVVEQAFVTPSCGTGSMAVEDAERVFKLLGETSLALREKYGFQ
ncbi:MAG TPA: hypothetical protein QF901_11410 [Gammaproteobacteria bacterium]|jgi:hypothetical protein|nr:hypothetical protein [Gammaproteobacteria bacterium]